MHARKRLGFAAAWRSARHFHASLRGAGALLGVLLAISTGCVAPGGGAAQGRRTAHEFQLAVTEAAAAARSAVFLVRIVAREGAPEGEGQVRVGGMTLNLGGGSGLSACVAVRVGAQGQLLAPGIIKAADSRVLVLVEGEEQEARVVATDEALGMTLVQLKAPPPGQALDLSRAATLVPGQWSVIVVARDEATDFEPEIRPSVCRGTAYDRYRRFLLDASDLRTVGAPVLDLDGVPVGFAEREGVVALADCQQELTGLLDRARNPAAVADSNADSNEEKAKGKVSLGITTQALNRNLATLRGLPRRALLVTCVVQNSAAAKAGLQVGDVITGLNGKPLRFQDSQLEAWFARSIKGRDGAPFSLAVSRGGKALTVAGTLSRRKEPEAMLADELGVTVCDIDELYRVAGNVPDDVRGVAVKDIRPGSPAATGDGPRGGLLNKGDIILELQGEPVPSLESFRLLLARQREHPKDQVLVKYRRGRLTGYVGLNLRRKDAATPQNGAR